jgi:hypothetical protein
MMAEAVEEGVGGEDGGSGRRQGWTRTAPVDNKAHKIR